MTDSLMRFWPHTSNCLAWGDLELVCRFCERYGEGGDIRIMFDNEEELSEIREDWTRVEADPRADDEDELGVYWTHIGICPQCQGQQEMF